MGIASIGTIGINDRKRRHRWIDAFEQGFEGTFFVEFAALRLSVLPARMAGRAQFFEIRTAFSVAAAGTIAAGFAAAELGFCALPCRPGMLLIAATLQFLQQGGEHGGISGGRLGALARLGREEQASQTLVARAGEDLIGPDGEKGGITPQITSRCFDQDVLDPAGELFGLGSRNQQQPGAATGEYGHLLNRPWRRETPEDREFLSLLGEIGNLPAPAEKVDRTGDLEEVVLDARSVEKQESQRRRVAKKWGEIRPGWRCQSGR